MNKFIFVMPLMTISLLASCGSKPSTEYLELWSKETLYSEDETVIQDETRKYQDKLMIQQIITEYSQESSEKAVQTIDYTYNEYGDVTVKKETRKIIENNKTADTVITRYMYQYQDGLMISKDIEKNTGNKYVPSHFEYKYDSNRRLISESATTGDGIPVYDDTYTYQNDFTNYLIYEHEDHPQSPGFDESYRIEHVLDNEGYITEETFYDLSNSGPGEKYQRAHYAYISIIV